MRRKNPGRSAGRRRRKALRRHEVIGDVFEILMVASRLADKFCGPATVAKDARAGRRPAAGAPGHLA